MLGRVKRLQGNVIEMMAGNAADCIQLKAANVYQSLPSVRETSTSVLRVPHRISEGAISKASTQLVAF